MDWRTLMGKRAVDVTVASLGLLAVAPLFPVIAVLVKLTSKGPVFYKQRRCGAERRSGARRAADAEKDRRKRGPAFNTFQMMKFRTMTVDAEKESGAVLAKENDPRLTPIGGFLRKTRLDELPQLFHVLSGDMSVVGPRPERPELMAKIEEKVPFFSERMLFIKPGITGLAQIKLRYDGSFNDKDPESQALKGFLANIETESEEELQLFANKLLYDLAYSAILENPSAWLKTDVEVIVKTPLVMLLGQGR